MDPKNQGIPRDLSRGFVRDSVPRNAFSTLGRYPAGLSYPGTKRYHFICMGCGHRGKVFVRERDLHFSVARERGIETCA